MDLLPVYKYIYIFLCEYSRLETGVLQLAEGSHLIVDETKLEAGTLNSVGVDNCRLLKNLMELQEVVALGCLTCSSSCTLTCPIMA